MDETPATLGLPVTNQPPVVRIYDRGALPDTTFPALRIRWVGDDPEGSETILKYKLWDVEVVIKEVLAYTVTFAFGMIAFSTVRIVDGSKGRMTSWVGSGALTDAICLIGVGEP